MLTAVKKQVLDGAWCTTLLTLGLYVVFVECIAVVWCEAVTKQGSGELDLQRPVWVREIYLCCDLWVQCFVVYAFVDVCVVMLPCCNDLTSDI